MTQRATRFIHAGEATEPPLYRLTLDAQDRYIRRRRVQLNDGSHVLVDLERAVQLADGDCLVLEGGGLVEIQAAREDLLQITGATPADLLKLAWHIGNRHLEAQIEETRILIRPDHVIAHMLEHQGARVAEVREAFTPESGAYHEEIGFEHGYSLTETHGHAHAPSHAHRPASDRGSDDHDGDD